MIPGMRIVRRLVFTLAFFAALFIGGNILLERVAEDRIAAAVQKSFSLDSKPAVEVDGFPIVLNAVTGDLPKVSIDARDVTVEQLTFRRVTVEVESIQTKGGVLGGGDLRVRVGGGRAEAEADEAAVNSMLKAQKQNATVKLRPDGATVTARRRFAGRVRTLVATGTVKLESRDDGRRFLIFEPSRVTVDGEQPPSALRAEARRQSRLRVSIPPLPAGIAVTGVETGAGYLTLVADLKGRSLTFGADGPVLEPDA